MRKLPYLLAATLLAIPANAQAQELTRASQRLELAAVAPVSCVISQPVVGNQSNTSFTATGTSSGQVNITQLVDAGAAPRASSIELSLPVLCNASHNIRISSANGGLLRTGAAGRGQSGAFQEFLGYQVGLDWAGQTVTLNSTTTNANINASQPAKGAMVIRIATPAGGAPLVAGQYSDSIVVEVQPAN
jgi:Spore Coat Protein U domain